MRHLLLVGPPASGKTTRVLGEVREALEGGRTDVCLLVPSATMAEHLRHELVRAGLAVPTNAVSTLHRFVEPWVGEWRPPSRALLQRLVREALERLAPRTFRAVSDLPGFRASLVDALEEFANAGCRAGHLRECVRHGTLPTPHGADLVAVYEAVSTELESRSRAHRGECLTLAAGQMLAQGTGGLRQVLLDGFFSFTEPELRVVQALAHHADVTVTLPTWIGSEPAQTRLLQLGFEEETLGAARRRSSVQVVATPTVMEEAEEIARRLLVEADAGRPFREMGVLVRCREPYVPALTLALERFGIPATCYHGELLCDQPVVRLFCRVAAAAIGQWDHATTLDALLQPAAGLGGTPTGDRFAERVREALPGRGLAELRALTQDERPGELIDALEALETRDTPRLHAGEWARRSGTLLRRLCAPPPSHEGVTHAESEQWRRRVQALKAFEGALEEVAEAWGGEAMAFAEFWVALETVLACCPFRLDERRRNVVHVLSLEEARQWELPVVFVCGLLEGQFPLRRGEDPLLPEGVRRALQEQGHAVRSAEEREAEERFLFDIALTRATERTVLTYPRCNEKGEPTLPSFFLSDLDVEREEGQPVRAWPRRERVVLRAPALRDEALLAQVATTHGLLGPTALEDYLQCRFLFFARHTLGLGALPLEPGKRLDALAEGTLVHGVLARWHARPESPVGELFDEEFDRLCERRKVPASFGREWKRLALRRDLEAFASGHALEAGWRTDTEVEFTLPLGDGLTLRGRIDRLDVGPGGRARVVDYKYTTKSGIARKAKHLESGRLLQGGLYALASRQAGHEPESFHFVGLRNGGGEKRWDAEELRGLMERAEEATLRVVSELRQGRIDILPLEEDDCQYCAFADACRWRTGQAAPARIAAAGGGSETGVPGI